MIPGNVNNSASSGAAGSGVQKTVFIKTSGSFTIPSDFASLVSIEAIGAGGNGAASTYVVFIGGSNGAGGGGGAYAKNDTLTGLTAGGTLYCNVPTTGGSAAAWANKTANTEPTSTADGVAARSASGSSRGTAASSVGTLTRDGGAGNSTYGGGGGAAGPNGSGGTGNSLGDGGTANGGLSGGGARGTYPGGAGSNGSYWVQSSDGTSAGPGGGGAAGMPGGAGGNYGGGGGGRYSGSTTASGGAGKPGIIVFTYLTT